MTGATSPTDQIDTTLAALPADQRAALQALRTAIAAAAPKAEEAISYGMPAFRYHGRSLPDELRTDRGAPGRARGLLDGQGDRPVHAGAPTPRRTGGADRARAHGPDRHALSDRVRSQLPA